MYGALPFTGWGRFVWDGYGYAMHVHTLFTHPLGLTLQPTICRSRRTEAPATARPQSPDTPAPLASVTGRASADRNATCGHRKPATDDAGPGVQLEQIQKNEIIATNVPLQCMNEPAPHRYFQHI